MSPWQHYRLYPNWTETLSHLVLKTTEQPFNNNKNQNKTLTFHQLSSSSEIHRIPSFYRGTFIVPKKTDLHPYPLDSFLQVSGWRKGVAFLNGHNLGRYWPVAGPQLTLYAPSVFFRPYPEENEIILFELEQSPCSVVINSQLKKQQSLYNDTQHHMCSIEFVDKHIINGTIPKSNVIVKKFINHLQ